MNTILIFGGAGFIGSNFARMWKKNHPSDHVVVFDKLTYCGNLQNLDNFEHLFIKGDISNAKDVSNAFAQIKPDYVINFAAETHVDRSIYSELQEFIDTNIQGVFNILHAVRHCNSTKRYIQVSTDETYGSLPLDQNLKFTEDSNFAPNVPYAATKAGGDMLCRAFFRTWNIPVIVTHCSNNYGEYQYPEKLIPFLTMRGLDGQSLTVHGDGKHVRDWIDVRDHCSALELLFFEGNDGDVYNIGANNEKSNLEIVEIIQSNFPGSQIEFLPDRLGNDRRYAIDSSKIQKLGWKPQAVFSKRIAETIRWYKRNQQWIEEIKDRAGEFNPSKQYEQEDQTV